MCFATFSCQTLRDGSAVLRIAPAIVCYESEEHKTMIAISLLALIVYVFAMACGSHLACATGTGGCATGP